MVSFTAANTSLILDVSVACVRLRWGEERSVYKNWGKAGEGDGKMPWDLLRIQIQVCAVYLVEAPEQVFSGSVDIVATRVVGKIIS